MARRLVGAAVLGAASLVAVAGTLLLCRRPLGDVVGRLRTGDGWAALPLDVAVAALAATCLAAATGWLVLVTLAATVEAVAGTSSALVRAVTPALVRRTVAVGCGLVLGTGAGYAATAVPADPGPQDATTLVDLLSGLPLPDRATGPGPATPGVRRAAGPVGVHPAGLPGPPGPEADATYLVRRGDSLWAIASRLLASTGPPRVDRAWRSLYRANRPTVGADPDLIRPGTVLQVPAALLDPAPSRGDGAAPSRPDRKDAS